MRAAILSLAIVVCTALTSHAQVFGGYYGGMPMGTPYGYGYSYQSWGYSPVPFGAGPAAYGGGATGPQWTQWNGNSGWTVGSQGMGQWNGNSGFFISGPRQPTQTYHYRAPATYQPHNVHHHQ